MPGRDAPVLERFAYDVAGRPLTQTHADGSERHWTYDNNATSAWTEETDERHNTRKLFSDPHGRVTDVEERDGSRVSRLTYGYDPADQVHTVTDDLGNVTTHTYDLLGNLDSTDDPDFGRWSWTWDLAGNLDTQTDARGRSLTFTYDELNRPETKRYPDGAQMVRRYDEPGHGAGIGYLTSIVDPTGESCSAGRSRSLTYDTAGQVTKDMRCVDGNTQTMEFEFDPLGRQEAVIYPDGERQTYGYDTAGRLRDMPGLVGEFNYDADGHMTKAERADSTLTFWTWDPKRRWLNEIAISSQVTGPMLKLNYTHERNGLVKTTTATPGGPNLSYTYDGLDRLTEVNGDLTERFTWNTIGNLETNSTVGTYTYPTSGPAGCTGNGTPTRCRGPHAASRAGDETYDYDANGNTTTIHTTKTHPTLKQYVVKTKQPGQRRDTLWAIAADHLRDPQRWPEIFALNEGRPYPEPPNGRFHDPHWIYPGQRLRMPSDATGLPAATATATTRRLDWDDDNQLAMIQNRSGDWTRMRYDADGDRVEKRKGNHVTHYFAPWLEDNFPGPGITKYYWAGPTLIARRDSRGLHYYHHDHLGSTRLLTTGQGDISARYNYKLAKYFLQVLAGVKNEDVVVDPDGLLRPGDVHEIPFRLTETDIVSDVILMVPAPGIVELRLITPAGDVIDPPTALGAPGSLYREGRNVQYYRLSLPAPVGSGAHGGDWRARLELGKRVPRMVTHGSLETGEAALAGLKLEHGLPYSLLVHTYSNLRMAATLTQSGFAPGASIGLRAMLSEYGLPVEGRASVTARVVDPIGLVDVVKLGETASGVFFASVAGTIPGTWEFRFHADGTTLRGGPFTREAVRTAALWHGGDREPRTSGPGGEGETRPDLSEAICRLLACLLSGRVIREDLRERLREAGFDVDALLSASGVVCRQVSVTRRLPTRSGFAPLRTAIAQIVRRGTRPDAVRAAPRRGAAPQAASTGRRVGSRRRRTMLRGARTAGAQYARRA